MKYLLSVSYTLIADFQPSVDHLLTDGCLPVADWQIFWQYIIATIFFITSLICLLVVRVYLIRIHTES